MRVRFRMLVRRQRDARGKEMAVEWCLSSITSLRTLIIATACFSEKPSSCKRCTNLRVSKWCSLLCRVVAWKARRRSGFCSILGFEKASRGLVPSIDLLEGVSADFNGYV